MNEGKMLWRACSSRHDWTDGALFAQVLAAAGRLGVIGPATAVKVGWDERPVPGTFEVHGMGERLLAAAGRSDPLVIDATGTSPSWSVFFAAWPYDRADRSVEGMNALELRFDASGLGREQLDALADAFFAVHTPQNTEYAVLHPYEHWRDFGESAYERPVTIGPMFRGVYWASFLGPGHADQFDRERLQGLPVHRMEWIDGPGLRLVANPDPRDCADPPVEALYRELTAAFRAALRPDSPWAD
ncbi:MAG TPA: hypothetical protein VEQ60_25035 [Longimicrobium sp.]|nr:hypothetical protein [Longimicrobium sp.]